MWIWIWSIWSTMLRTWVSWGYSVDCEYRQPYPNCCSCQSRPDSQISSAGQAPGLRTASLAGANYGSHYCCRKTASPGVAVPSASHPSSWCWRPWSLQDRPFSFKPANLELAQSYYLDSCIASVAGLDTAVTGTHQVDSNFRKGRAYNYLSANYCGVQQMISGSRRCQASELEGWKSPCF